MSAILPFPRGKTFSQNADSTKFTLSDQNFKSLEGKTFEVTDTVHGTGEKIKLRVVKNDSGAAITVAADRLVMFSVTSDTDFGNRVSGYNTVAGGVCKPIDDDYAVGFSIPDDDLFYIIEEGLCDIEAENTGISAGNAVASNNTAQVNNAVAAAGEYVVGTAQEASAASTALLVRVAPGFALPDAA